MKNYRKPLFISFEGGEGSGKSTQAKKLYDYFKAKGEDVILTREPGGTDVAEQIREILVTGSVDKLDKKTELLLHYAARTEHIRKVIKPAFNEGKIVITDRYFDSTIAYQGYGHGLNLEFIAKLNDFIVEDIKPDITFLFDIELKVGIERAKGRSTDNEKRYESMNLGFHERLKAGFLKIAENEPERCFIINANDSIENLHIKVLGILNDF